jgi:hypothetical protein
MGTQGEQERHPVPRLRQKRLEIMLSSTTPVKSYHSVTFAFAGHNFTFPIYFSGSYNNS